MKRVNHRSINTRNRPKSDVREGDGLVSAVVTLNDACSILEEAHSCTRDQKFKKLFDDVTSLCYKACDIIERSYIGDSAKVESIPPLRTSVLELPAVPAMDGVYKDNKGNIEGDKLEVLGRAIGPWECGSNHCRSCPFSEDKTQEQKRRQCLDFYLAEQVKKLAVDELATGIPYTLDQLRSLHKRDLVALTRILGVNKMKTKGQSASSLIGVIHGLQKEYKEDEAV